MENINILNKALKAAAETLKTIEPQRKVFEDSIPDIKRQLQEAGADISIITKMENAAKNGDLKAIIKLKSQIQK